MNTNIYIYFLGEDLFYQKKEFCKQNRLYMGKLSNM